MAEIKKINTRISLKCDTLTNWSNASNQFILNKGEVAIAQIGEKDIANKKLPPIMFKVGDGEHTFNELDWTSALAADVYDWAKAATPQAIIAEARRGLIGADSVVKTLNGLKGELTLSGDDTYFSFESAGSTITLKLSEAAAAVLGSGITADKVAKYDGYEATINSVKATAEGKQNPIKGGTHVTIGADKVTINALWPTANDAGYEGIGKVGTVTGVKMNGGAVKNPDAQGVVDLGAVVTDVSGKQDKAIEIEGITAKTVEGALSEAKKAGTDAAAALNTYKTNNDAALAAVKKTADDNKAAIAQINIDLGGLTGAMHFVGTSTTDPKTGATVEGHATFKAGDVCLFGAKEYVYNGTTWIELGDEGSHATRDYVDNSVQTAKEAVEGELTTAVSTLEGKIATAKSEAITEAGTAADGKIAEALKAYTTTEALNAELAKKLEAKDLNGYAKETYVDTAKSTLLGYSEDDATKETIRGARKLAQSGVDAAAAAQETADSKCTLDEVKALGYTTNVGTVTSVAAGTGLKVTGTASVTPTIEIDTAVIFELDCGSATTIIA
jgi:hypothetical protein